MTIQITVYCYCCLRHLTCSPLIVQKQATSKHCHVFVTHPTNIQKYVPLSPTQILKTCMHFSIIKILFFSPKNRKSQTRLSQTAKPLQQTQPAPGTSQIFSQYGKEFHVYTKISAVPKTGILFIKISGCKVQNLKGAILINPNFCTQHFWSSLSTDGAQA